MGSRIAHSGKAVLLHMGISGKRNAICGVMFRKPTGVHETSIRSKTWCSYVGGTWPDPSAR